MALVAQNALADWSPGVTAAAADLLVPSLVALAVFFVALEVVDRIWWRPSRTGRADAGREGTPTGMTDGGAGQGAPGTADATEAQDVAESSGTAPARDQAPRPGDVPEGSDNGGTR